MANPQLRPGMFAGSARIGGTVGLINVTGIITGVTKTGTGQYTLTLEPGANPNEHNYSVTPILTGFNADASGSVDVSNPAAPVVQTAVGGVAADCDCYVEVKRVLTTDGTVFPSPAAVPAGPPAPPGAGLTLLGSNLVEVSSNSLSLVPLTSVSGLSIPTTQPVWIGFDFRKSAGAAVAPVFGLRLNAVDTNDASAQPIAFTGSVNEAQSGHGIIRIGSRDNANYLRGGVATQAVRGATDGADSNAPVANNAALPSVVITDVTITGKTPNAAVTFAAKNVFVWAPPST